MAKGIIKKLNNERGFGFITAEVVDGKKGGDLFFHRSMATDFDTMNEGDPVEFESEDSKKGPRAVNVKRVA